MPASFDRRVDIARTLSLGVAAAQLANLAACPVHRQRLLRSRTGRRFSIVTPTAVVFSEAEKTGQEGRATSVDPLGEALPAERNYRSLRQRRKSLETNGF